MKLLFNIRNYYKPIQPTIIQSAENVFYTEIFPDEKLLPFIYCYWTLKTTSQLAENYVYRVISDGCIDVFFELDNPDESYLMGFCRSYTEFPLGKEFNYVGIRFLPSAFPLIFKQDAKELSNNDIFLNLISSDLATFIAHKFSSLQGLQQIKNELDTFFSKHLKKID